MEALTYSETTHEFLEFLKVNGEYRTDSLDLLEEGKSRYVADLKVNFKNSFESDYLSKKEIALLGVALAVNANNNTLKQFFAKNAQEEGASAEGFGFECGAESGVMGWQSWIVDFSPIVRKTHNGISAAFSLGINHAQSETPLAAGFNSRVRVCRERSRRCASGCGEGLGGLAGHARGGAGEDFGAGVCLCGA